MLYAFRNPFSARRNRPSADDLRYALIVAPENRMEVLSRYPGVLTSAAEGFGTKDHEELSLAMGVVDELLNDGDNRYWRPVSSPGGAPRKLYPYQLSGVTFILARKGRALVMDPMGLGKTLQGVAALAAGGFLPEEALPGDTPYLPAVVVCPANAVPSWVDDFREWAPGIEVQTVRDVAEARRALLALPGNPRVLVLTKEQFTGLAGSLGDNLPVLFQNRVQTVVVDESHYAKNSATQLAQALLATAPHVPHMILLTGTPLLNAAGELYSQLQILEASESAAPFFADQDQLLRHMAGGPVDIRSQSDFRDYEDYSPSTVQGVNRYLRKRGLRRSRADAVRSGIVLYPRARNQSEMRKVRSLRVVPHSPSNLTELGSAFAAYLQGLQDARGDSAEKQAAFLERADNFAQFKRELAADVHQALQQGPLTEAKARKLISSHLAPLRRVLLRGHFPVNEKMKTVIADTIIPAVTEYVADRKRPVVVFTDRKRTRDNLVKRLLDMQRRRQIASKRIYSTEGSKEVYVDTLQGQETLPQGGLSGLKARFKDPRAVAAEDRNAVIILTKSGLEGLNLAGAEEVVFAGRFDNPGQEYQAEDRINRPQQVTPPRATYFLALDPFSLSLSNRQEKKRNSILSTLGESPTSDYSHPMDTRAAQGQVMGALPAFRRVFGNDLIEPFFAELAPEAFLRQQIEAVQKDGAPPQAVAAVLGQRRAEQQKQQWMERTLERLKSGAGASASPEQRLRAVEIAYTAARGSRVRGEAVLEAFGRRKRIPWAQVLYMAMGSGRILEHEGPARRDPDRPERILLGRMRLDADSIVILSTNKRKPMKDRGLVEWLKEIFHRSTMVRRNPRARENLPLADFEVKPTDASEEQIRRIRLSLFQKFITSGYSRHKAIRVMGRVYGPGERLDPTDAKTLAFQVAGRRGGSRYLYRGTNRPTELSRHRAREKRQDESAFRKRKEYEDMLAVGRRSGPYRVTHEPSYKTGKPVFYLWPQGREYKTEEGVRRAWERLK